MLQIHNLKKKKVTTFDISNFVYVHPNIEDMTIMIILPDDSEIVFKIGSHRLLVLWMAALKVSISKGTCYVCNMGRSDLPDMYANHNCTCYICYVTPPGTIKIALAYLLKLSLFI